MEEARLIHLLRGLPRETAHGGFTTRVLQRLDEPERPLPWRRHESRSVSWNRMMVATATMGALGVSVGLSVGLLQHDRAPMSALSPMSQASPAALAASLGPLAPSPAQRDGRTSSADMASVTGIAGIAALPNVRNTATAGRVALTVTSMDRTFRHEGAAGEEPALGSGARHASNQSGGGLDAAQAHQMWRELQLESGRLERELGSLRQPGRGKPGAVLYLGGDDNVDLVLNTGRTRSAGQPAGERDDGEDLDYL